MKKLTYILSVVTVSAALFSCASSVKEVPEGLSAAQLIQQGQNYYSSGKYKTAEMFYEAAIQRYGTDATVFLESKYELGHTYLKEKKYEQAYDTFNEILEIYDYSAGRLPGAYKKLANIGLSEISEKKVEQIKQEKAARATKEAEEIAKAKQAEKAAAEARAEEERKAAEAIARAEAEKAEREAAVAQAQADSQKASDNQAAGISEDAEQSDEIESADESDNLEQDDSEVSDVYDLSE